MKNQLLIRVREWLHLPFSSHRPFTPKILLSTVVSKPPGQRRLLKDGSPPQQATRDPATPLRDCLLSNYPPPRLLLRYSCKTLSSRAGHHLVVGSNPIFTFQAKGFAGTTGNVLYALRYVDDDGAILSDSGLQFFQDSINPDTYTGFSFDLGPVPTGASSAFVEFSQAIGPIDDNNLAGLVLVDNISLVDPNAVPEPSTLSMIGLGGIVILLRRRRALA